MASILFASVPVHGHVTPLLSAAGHFVARGDRVRFLTGSRFAGSCKRPARSTSHCRRRPTSTTGRPRRNIPRARTTHRGQVHRLRHRARLRASRSRPARRDHEPAPGGTRGRGPGRHRVRRWCIPAGSPVARPSTDRGRRRGSVDHQQSRHRALRHGFDADARAPRPVAQFGAEKDRGAYRLPAGRARGRRGPTTRCSGAHCRFRSWTGRGMRRRSRSSPFRSSSIRAPTRRPACISSARSRPPARGRTHRPGGTSWTGPGPSFTSPRERSQTVTTTRSSPPRSRRSPAKTSWSSSPRAGAPWTPLPPLPANARARRSCPTTRSCPRPMSS